MKYTELSRKEQRTIRYKRRQARYRNKRDISFWRFQVDDKKCICCSARWFNY